MVDNVKKTTRVGNRYVFVYRYGASGFPINIDGTTPANGNADGNGGGYQIEMPQDFPLVNPTPDDILLDSEVRPVSFGNLLGPAQRLSPFTAVVGTFDLEFQGWMQGTTPDDEGPNTFGHGLPQDPRVPTVSILQMNKAKVRGGANDGKESYAGNYLLSAQMSWLGAAAISLRGAHTNQWQIEGDATRYNLTGETFTSAADNTCSLVYRPWHGPCWLDIVTWYGDGAQTTFNFPRQLLTGSVDADVIIAVNRARQTPTTDYVVSVGANNVTFQAGAIPAAGEAIIALYNWCDEC